MCRSAENQRVGSVTIAAWQMEDRAEHRMSVSLSGRVRGPNNVFYGLCMSESDRIIGTDVFLFVSVEPEVTSAAGRQ